METEVQEMVVAATGEIFETMLFTEVLAGEPLGDEPAVIASDVTAQIAMSGHISGIVSLHLPAALALELVSTLTAAEFAEVNDQVCDGVGEIANMIAGSMKTKLGDLERQADISIPTVVRGTMEWLHVKGAKAEFPRVIIPFRTDAHTFHVDILCGRS